VAHLAAQHGEDGLRVDHAGVAQVVQTCDAMREMADELRKKRTACIVSYRSPHARLREATTTSRQVTDGRRTARERVSTHHRRRRSASPP